MKRFRLFLRGFGYAFRGIRHAVRSHANLRLLTVIALIVVATGMFFSVNPMEWCALLLCIGSVLSAELINSAIEEHVNLTHPDYDPQAGRIKDMAAAAVLLLAVVSVIVGALIFLPYLFPDKHL